MKAKFCKLTFICWEQGQIFVGKSSWQFESLGIIYMYTVINLKVRDKN